MTLILEQKGSVNNRGGEGLAKETKSNKFESWSVRSSMGRSGEEVRNDISL